MAIPTPKTPTRRSSNIPTTTPKKHLSETKKPASSVRSSQSFTKKTLPTPPSRERFHQEHRAKSSSGGIRSTLISLLIIGVVVMLWWTNRDSIIHYLDSLWLRWESAILQNDPNALFVGKEVELTGTLVAWGKSWLYTHTMQSSYGTLWLRSTSINLKDFVGEVKLWGQIMDFVDNTYIIDVRNISFLTMPIRSSLV